MKKLYSTILLVLLSIYSHAQSPNWQWENFVGSSNNESGNAITMDGSWSDLCSGEDTT